MKGVYIQDAGVGVALKRVGRRSSGRASGQAGG